MDKTIYLPPSVGMKRPQFPVEPLFQIGFGDATDLTLAWEGGCAVDYHIATEFITTASVMNQSRPIWTSLPFHPHRIPVGLRDMVRKILVARCCSVEYPRWPIEPSLEIFKAITRSVGLSTLEYPWPDENQYAFCLSHDVDTSSGQKNARKMADVEESLGFRSAWFLAPGNYTVDQDFWNDMSGKGHEVACHGLHHDFKIAFLPPHRMNSRLNRAIEGLESFEVKGFRSPGFYMSPDLWEAVSDRFFYDSSIPDTTLLPCNNGGVDVFPYRIGSLIEIPVTMPYDGEMLALKLETEKRLVLWKRKAFWIKDVGGLIHLLTHPDSRFTAGSRELGLYRRFLEWVRAKLDGGWETLPIKVASHFAETPRHKNELTI